eukprot:TRINITY_DN17156_c0_g1_i1.p1 TRINITY_DN17156_c0_g1~~TRINITY_DN17156_c0_g1_i1.p1  ORF type:complete len:365 (-),score=67.11 TRINITY_DN17156_c0_g1_i1:4-1098(-)
MINMFLRCLILVLNILVFGLLIFNYSPTEPFSRANVTIQANKLALDKNYKVDLVYTWVNGSDPKFKENLKLYKEKQRYLRENEYKEGRFFDGSDLKFSLRSVEKYLDWYNNIYIVTNGQIPNWLNISHPRIKIVTHKEIFKNHDDLPTFNSVAIESNIHRIENLTEEFIYLNDDFLFGSRIRKSDYFLDDGSYKLYACDDSPTGFTSRKTCAYGNSLKFVNRLFDKKFGAKKRRGVCHVPHLVKKSVINNLQEMFPEEFKKTSSHKFRSPDDMQFIFSYNNFFKNQGNYYYIEMDPIRYSWNMGKKQAYDLKIDFQRMYSTAKFLCIQDDLTYKVGENVSAIMENIDIFFNKFFPFPSQFELVN